MSSSLLVAHVLCLLAVLVCLQPGKLAFLLPELLTGLGARPQRVDGSHAGARLRDDELRQLLLQRARDNTLLRNPALVR